jgi:hypothetical protein
MLKKATESQSAAPVRGIERSETALLSIAAK